MLADKIKNFLFSLPTCLNLPEHINVLNPYGDEEVIRVVNAFYSKYYTDNKERILILGINPGRFGSGITGVAFSDPIRLAEICGIKNDFLPRPELSSVFMYDLIRRFGGAEAFYTQFYINSVCPLGFTSNGKNWNYYDEQTLFNSLKPFILQSIRAQIDMGMSQKIAFCLGEGKNFSYLSKLNAEALLFEQIIPLSHPRFVMQYKLKTKDEYIERMVRSLTVQL